MKKSHSKVLKVIGVYQMIGGAWGLIAVFASMTLNSPSISSLVVVTTFLLLYIFSLVSGFYMLTKRELGLKLSIINQALQVVWISVGTFNYMYICGTAMFLKLGINPNLTIGFEFILESKAMIGIYKNNLTTSINVNVIAQSILGYLWKTRPLK